MSITHISDTARWVALYRARESERPDALFHDPFARRLAGPEGERMVRRLEAKMRGEWPVIVRTAVMDEIVLRLVGSGVRQVLNLAAGLDARPWRLALPPTLHWIDVDLAGVLDHKLHVLAGESPRCQYTAEPIDLTDVAQRRELLARLDAMGETLVLTEGLLVYLDAAMVATLAGELHAVRACRYWLCDLASPDLLRIAAEQRGPKDTALDAAVLRFAPEDASAWFAAHGWSEVEFRSTVNEGIRLQRTAPLGDFWDQLGPSRGMSRKERIRRFSGIVLFERLALRGNSGME